MSFPIHAGMAEPAPVVPFCHVCRRPVDRHVVIRGAEAGCHTLIVHCHGASASYSLSWGKADRHLDERALGKITTFKKGRP